MADGQFNDPNRRAFARTVIRQPATLAVGDTTTPVQTLDVGQGGMCFLAGRPIGPGGAADAFEPFFPARGATSTGICLAVTRTIVAALGGDATLSPRDGGGAVATIRLPRR